MVEEPTPRYIRPGLHFDAGPLGLDLYRLLCLYLADQKVMSVALASEEKGEAPTGDSLVRTLHDSHVGAETLRILISTAVTLRIAFDQYSGEVFDPILQERPCGRLWPDWRNNQKYEALTIREACNKIIHA